MSEKKHTFTDPNTGEGTECRWGEWIVARSIACLLVGPLILVRKISFTIAYWEGFYRGVVSFVEAEAKEEPRKPCE